MTTQEVLCVEENNQAAKVIEMVADLDLYNEKVNVDIYNLYQYLTDR